MDPLSNPNNPVTPTSKQILELASKISDNPPTYAYYLEELFLNAGTSFFMPD
jgi:hypothetical protein